MTYAFATEMLPWALSVPAVGTAVYWVSKVVMGQTSLPRSMARDPEVRALRELGR